MIIIVQWTAIKKLAQGTSNWLPRLLMSVYMFDDCLNGLTKFAWFVWPNRSCHQSYYQMFPNCRGWGPVGLVRSCSAVPLLIHLSWPSSFSSHLSLLFISPLLFPKVAPDTSAPRCSYDFVAPLLVWIYPLFFSFSTKCQSQYIPESVLPLLSFLCLLLLPDEWLQKIYAWSSPPIFFFVTLFSQSEDSWVSRSSISGMCSCVCMSVCARMLVSHLAIYGSVRLVSYSSTVVFS